MAQITKGIRAVLSHPIIYSAFQKLMGARMFWQDFASTSIRPFQGMKVLDIGCGPADILAYLPGVDYWGFDINERYINYARVKFGNRGHFQCKTLQLPDLADLPRFDVVLALGLLHHLDDLTAVSTIKIAFKVLKPGGKLLTIDPCLEPSQNRIARYLISHDRGRNVRDRAGYEALVTLCFKNRQIVVRHRAWVPYTHCLMKCQR
jgi:SAM-dependent methyltransferase